MKVATFGRIASQRRGGMLSEFWFLCDRATCLLCNCQLLSLICVPWRNVSRQQSLQEARHECAVFCKKLGIQIFVRFLCFVLLKRSSSHQAVQCWLTIFFLISWCRQTVGKIFGKDRLLWSKFIICCQSCGDGSLNPLESNGIQNAFLRGCQDLPDFRCVIRRFQISSSHMDLWIKSGLFLLVSGWENVWKMQLILKIEETFSLAILISINLSPNWPLI